MNEKVLKDDYVVLHSWMIDLFKANEKSKQVDLTKAVIFAYIYSFSKDGKSKWYGQQQTLADYIGIASPTICNKLKEMVNDGFIDKEEVQCFGMFHHNNYSVNPNYLRMNQPLTEVNEPLNRVNEPLINNNTSNNTDNNNSMSKDIEDKSLESENSKEISNNTVFNEDDNKVKKDSVKHKYGTYKHVLLTDDELNKLKAEFPNNWEYWIDTLDTGIELKGYKYKNCYLAIKNWAKNTENKSFYPPKENKSFYPPKPNLAYKNNHIGTEDVIKLLRQNTENTSFYPPKENKTYKNNNNNIGTEDLIQSREHYNTRLDYLKTEYVI